MTFLLFFIGGFGLASGILYIIDTVVWRIYAGDNFAWFGECYALTRHRFYFEEISLGIIASLASIILLLWGLRHIKKCVYCNKYITKNQKFCHNCGGKIK